MIGVGRLSQVLRVIAVSGLVKNGNPISATLIAPSDAGKSELLSKTLPPHARVINDFTTASMQTLLNEKSPPKWIVVPDFNQVISHKPSVATLAMAFLLSLLAEGITEIPGVDGKVKLQAKHFKKRGLRIALLTGMTPDMFKSRRRAWRSTGLLRRLVPIYYTYGMDTQRHIQKSIRAGVDQLDYTAIRQKSLKPCTIVISKTLSHEIERLSQAVTDNQLVWRFKHESGNDNVQKAHDFPFSVHKMFRNYVKAHALLRGARGHVATQADFIGLCDFAKFVRYDRPEEL